MEAHAEHAHHHELPTSGNALTGVAISATLHCLTGCAIGEVAGMAIGTALGFSDLGTIALAVGLAFIFGYLLTSLPLLRAGLALGAVIPIALASDTLSIATMEVVDNAIMLIVPGAMESGLGDVLFWGALSFALAVAFVLTVPVNRWLLARGKGHTAVHNTGIHGGPPTRMVGVAITVAAIFGTSVLVAEAISDDGGDHGGGHQASAMPADATARDDDHAEEETMPASTDTDTVRGLTATDDGLELELEQTEIERAQPTKLSFRVSEDGRALTDFEVEHTKKLHLIVVRDDLTGFQHLHPTMADDGTWSTPLTLPQPGSYRVFADFNSAGTDYTLARDLLVDGETARRALPAQSTEATTETGYEVGIEGAVAEAGEESMLSFNVLLDGEPVEIEPYLGADGHLVALREGDLAYLHVHPLAAESGGGHEGGGHGAQTAAAPGSISFMTEFPTGGRYRLFLQFKHEGAVHTAAFTREASG